MNNNLKEKLDNIAKEANAVGVSALICNKDEIIYKYFYGKRDLENNLDTVDGTIYRIASISKVIVGMGIMMLHDEGKLNIYEDISKYLGYTVKNPHHPNHPITLKLLMTQTSSISDGNHETLGYDGVNGISDYVKLEDLLVNTESKYYYDKTTSSDYHHPLYGRNYNNSEIKTYIESTIYNLLPNDLRTNIHNTKIKYFNREYQNDTSVSDAIVTLFLPASKEISIPNLC